MTSDIAASITKTIATSIATSIDNIQNGIQHWLPQLHQGESKNMNQEPQTQPWEGGRVTSNLQLWPWEVDESIWTIHGSEDNMAATASPEELMHLALLILERVDEGEAQLDPDTGQPTGETKPLLYLENIGQFLHPHTTALLKNMQDHLAETTQSPYDAHSASQQAEVGFVLIALGRQALKQARQQHKKERERGRPMTEFFRREGMNPKYRLDFKQK